MGHGSAKQYRVMQSTVVSLSCGHRSEFNDLQFELNPNSVFCLLACLVFYLFSFFQGRTQMQSPTTTNRAVEFFHLWENHRSQHIPSAMDKPHPGKTTFVIVVFPLPSKYCLLVCFRRNGQADPKVQMEI